MFREASKELLDQIETMVKLIRSKGVGLFFITQDPTDVPDRILSQLGMKVQHALRAFTVKDRKAIKAIAENFPVTEYYKTADLLTSLGVGEALITVLNEKGIPTALAHTYLVAPQSRMDVLDPVEINQCVSKSKLFVKYNEEIDRESAFEILNSKLKARAEEEKDEKAGKNRKSENNSRREKSVIEKVAESSIGRTIVRELTRGLLGVLGIKQSTRRKGGMF
jgi:DNA helicase HerA-like ATPase